MAQLVATTLSFIEPGWHLLPVALPCWRRRGLNQAAILGRLLVGLVLASDATSEACAAALERAGAERAVVAFSARRFEEARPEGERARGLKRHRANAQAKTPEAKAPGVLVTKLLDAARAVRRPPPMTVSPDPSCGSPMLARALAFSPNQGAC
jgi:hypothetical protein